jgi:RNA polymerase sigma-70 factor (ECF subfamily)
VAAFLAASRNGEFDTLLALLDPAVVLRADDVTVQMGATPEVHGASAVAETFSGRARAAQPVLVDGQAGAMWAVDGRPRVVFEFKITDGMIARIEMISDPTILGRLDLELLSD